MSQNQRETGDTLLTCLDAGSVGRRIVAALPTMFARGVSLHDVSGRCHWRSGAMVGPSEHIAVRAALEAFVGQTAPARIDQHLPDGTSAILLNSRSSDFEFTGFVMLIVTTSRLKVKGRAAPDLPIPVIRAVRHWGDLAAMHAAGGATTAAEDPAAARPPLSAEAAPASAVANSSAPANAVQSSTGDTGKYATAVLLAQESLSNHVPHEDQLERERCAAALRDFPMALFAQRLVPLHPDARIRRYEILLRRNTRNAPEAAPEALLRNAEAMGLGSIIDRRVITSLVAWLRSHAAVWASEPSQFSVNLSMTSLCDPDFMAFVSQCLRVANLPSGILVFEIDQHRARDERARISAMAEGSQGAGTGLVIDNFTLHDNSVDLLMLPGLRLLKIDRRLTADLSQSRGAQAVVAGIAQMARIAGVHSVAKQIDDPQEHLLLRNLGVDFVQSFATAMPTPLDALRADITERMIVDNTVLDDNPVPAYLAAQPM